MEDQKSSDKLTEESVELTRALAELREWSSERRRVLQEYEEFIQRALATGRLTARRTGESQKKYLSDRMIATMTLDCSMSKRSILMMSHREREIRARLAEIAAQSVDEEKSA